MKQEDVDDLREVFEESIHKVFNRYGSLQPKVLCSKDGALYPVSIMGPTTSDKFCKAVRAICYENKCEFVAVACEVWSVRVKGVKEAREIKNSGVAIEDHENKEEKVIMVFETQKGTEAFVYEIDRSNNTLVNKTKALKINEVFQNLLPK